MIWKQRSAGTRALRRIAGGRLYTAFAGSNVLTEIWPALAGACGAVPLEDAQVIARYERAFAAAAGTRYAVSFATGRMAFYALLEALGVGPGDEVILPAYTCVVVPNAIIYRGARPIYVDIDPSTFNIDLDEVEARITPRTRAIVAQHTYGLICDVDRLNAIAQTRGIAVLEDCAHSLGATRDGRSCGGLGTAGYFSTDHTKIINTGTGGMVTTDDDALAGRVREIQYAAPQPSPSRTRTLLALLAAEILLLHPRVAPLGRHICALLWRALLHRSFYLDELSVTKPVDYPYPARLSAPQARIGLSQLSRLAENLAARRSAVRRFAAALAASTAKIDAERTDHAWLRFPFLVSDRDAWQAHCSDVLEMPAWFSTVTYGRERDFEAVGYEPGSCPRAEEIARHVVNLPTHPRVDQPERLAELLCTACASRIGGLRVRAASAAATKV